MTGVPAAIEVRGLRKKYGKKLAVDGISFDVPVGTTFGLLGPNGAGKSTTVKILAGLVRPTEGTALVLGGSPTDTVTRRSVGYVPEQFRFPEWMTAGEFVAFHAALADVPGGERAARVEECLELVGLSHRRGDILGTFSKGMLQRIGIAQALVGRPRLVILDEPTSALDPIGRRDVRALIMRLREAGVTVVLNSHLLGEVELTCDRIVILDRGRVVEEGTMEALIGDRIVVEVRATDVGEPLLAVIRGRWGQPEALSVESAITSFRVTVESEAELAAIARVMHDAGASIRALVPRRRSLEDLFVAHVLTDESGRSRGAQ